MKNLVCGKSSGWVVARRTGKIYLDDDIKKVFGIGKRLKTKLVDNYNVQTIYSLDLLLRDDIQRDKLEADIGVKVIDQWEQFIDESVEQEMSPALIDYRDKGNPHSNPYHLRYKENWLYVIKKVAALSPYICITDYVQHIYDKVCPRPVL